MRLFLLRLLRLWRDLARLLLLTLHLLQLFQQLFGSLGLLLAFRCLLLLLLLFLDRLVGNLLGWRLGLIFRYFRGRFGLRLVEYRLRRRAGVAGGQRGSAFLVQQNELYERGILRVTLPIAPRPEPRESVAIPVRISR